MKISKVTKCEVEECAYNVDQVCHAMAITIGDSDNPRCDTFCKSSQQGGSTDWLANVGACKVSCCTNNENLECQSAEICVGYNGEEADCMTFKHR